MRITAAIARAPNEAFSVEPVDLRAPGDGEVLVRIIGVGICHTDVRARDLKVPVSHPIVLGHEGAGVVERVGPGVLSLAHGDHVVLTFDSCGTCGSCRSGAPAICTDFAELNFGGGRDRTAPAFSRRGAELHGGFFGQSAFATHALANERNAIKIRDDVPIDLMGPLGCSVQTGAGTVLNVLRSEPGLGLAVFGAGAVGLSAILAAIVAGMAPIVAVDVTRSRLDLALELGATHAVDPTIEDSASEILSITGGAGVTAAIDTTGAPEVIGVAVAALAKGGTCALLTGGEPETRVPLELRSLLDGRTLTGVIEGMSVPHVLIPALADLYAAGKLPFDRFARIYPLAGINDAVADMRNGEVVKPILVPGAGA